MKSALISGVVFLLLACACATPGPVDPDAWPAGMSYIEVRGTGVPDPASVSESQRKYTSREAARIEAQALLLRRVERLPMEQVGRAAAAEQKDPAFANGLQAAIRGATETQAAWDASDHCTVTLRVYKRTLEELDGRFQF